MNTARRRLRTKSGADARTLKHFERRFELKSIDEKGVFDGYLSVFGNVDSYGDVVMPGAFAKTLAKWKALDRLPPVLWQHRSGEPLGPFLEMREDNVGLYVRGQLLVDDVPRAREARALLKAKAINGMSIGYVSVVESYDKTTGIISLMEIDLWEGSIVTFPANQLAGVSGVKSEIDRIESLADAERWLRDAAGLSKSGATGFIARIKSLGRSESDGLDDDLLKSLQSLKSSLQIP